jgi:hypothetical protein
MWRAFVVDGHGGLGIFKLQVPKASGRGFEPGQERGEKKRETLDQDTQKAEVDS